MYMKKRSHGIAAFSFIIPDVLAILLFGSCTFAAELTPVSDGSSSYSYAAGLQFINGRYYYVNESGEYVKGWFNDGSYIYYFTDAGAATGLSRIGKRIFLFNESGQLQTGWQTVSGNTYYFKPKGKPGKYGMAICGKTVSIDGNRYTFSSEGVCQSSSSGSATKTTKTPSSNGEFIRMIGELAHEDMQRTGVLASITVAQAIVESSYGKSSLATEACNLFGMKGDTTQTTWAWASPWNGAVCMKKTQEYVNGSYVTINAKFRAYSSYEESIADHSAYLANAKLGDGTLRYKGLVGNKNYRSVAQIIKDGGYATAPNYVSSLCSLVEQYNLTQYD